MESDVEDFPGTYLALGNVCYKRGEYVKSLEAYTEALKHVPNWAIALYNRSLVYSTIGEHDSAATDRERAFQLRPDLRPEWNGLARATGDAFVDLGNRAIDSGDMKAALSNYFEAIRLNPQSSEGFVGLGLVFSKTGETDKAIKAYSKAIELNDRCVEGHYNRGNRYLALGKHDLAISDFSVVISLKPDDGEVYYQRSRAYCAKGDLAAADMDRAVAIRLDPRLDR
jgi:tetratricopeptide (TPR) repeat protein